MQIEAITKELSAHLDYDSASGRYAITGAELRGIIARAISRTTAQLAMDVGRALTADAVPMISAQFDVPRQVEGDISYEQKRLSPDQPY
jgi:hypothetical protein